MHCRLTEKVKILHVTQYGEHCLSIMCVQRISSGERIWWWDHAQPTEELLTYTRDEILSMPEPQVRSPWHWLIMREASLLQACARTLRTQSKAHVDVAAGHCDWLHACHFNQSPPPPLPERECPHQPATRCKQRLCLAHAQEVSTDPGAHNPELQCPAFQLFCGSMPEHRVQACEQFSSNSMAGICNGASCHAPQSVHAAQRGEAVFIHGGA